MRISRFAIAPAVLVLLAAACAKPPVKELEAKKQRVRTAIQQSEAQAYAPASVRSVQDSLAAIDASIAAQGRRFPLFRKYDSILPRLANLDAALEDMAKEARLNKETMHTEVVSCIAEANSIADSVETEYHGAPAVKDARTMMGLIQGELAEVRGLLVQAKSSVEADQIAAARDQARSGRDRARKLLNDVRSSKTKVQALRARRVG